VTHIGRHSLPDVCRRPTRTVSRSGSGRHSAWTPAPRRQATTASPPGPIRGTRIRSFRRRISASPIPSPSTREKCRSPSGVSLWTQYRNASMRVLVPASPEWPSVSITANGRPSMMYR
jgi:hypothetical protein